MSGELCLLCDEFAKDYFCSSHLSDFDVWLTSNPHNGSPADHARLTFVGTRIRTLRAEINATMQTVIAEVRHLRSRANEFLSDPTTANAYQLAHSCLKHLNRISKEDA